MLEIRLLNGAARETCKKLAGVHITNKKQLFVT